MTDRQLTDLGHSIVAWFATVALGVLAGAVVAGVL